MYRKYICVEVVILFLLSHVVWNGPSTTLFSCSYEDSQVVQFLIQNKLLPILGRYRASLPLDCPFHSMRDIYSWSKLSFPSNGKDDGATWLCPLCGQRVYCNNAWPKTANNEYYVLSNGAEDAVCLASYCDIMRCEVISKRMKTESLRQTSVVPSLKIKTDDKESAQILERYKKMETPQKMPCDPKKMEALMERCRAVIRQCTIGLLINLSVKDFEDIEDEMNKAICSYLTCERFWDDNLTEVRHVAVILCIIIGLIIIGGFCFCYYIVWVLFGSLPQEDQNQADVPDAVNFWCNDINANSSLPSGVNGQFLYPWPPPAAAATASRNPTSSSPEQRLPRR